MLLVVLDRAALAARATARRTGEPVAVTVFGIGYVNWLLGYAFWLRDLEAGQEWVLLLVWVTWLGETAAYLVGSTLGRHKLAPRVSPKQDGRGRARPARGVGRSPR